MKNIFLIILLLIGFSTFADTVELKSGGQIRIDSARPTTILCEAMENKCKLEFNSTGMYITYESIKISENFENGILARKELTSLQKAGHCR